MNQPPTQRETETLAADLRNQLKQAAAQLGAGQAQLALHTVESALQRHPHSDQLTNLAGICAATVGNVALANEYWRQSINLNPGNPQPYFNLGLLCANLKRHDEAIPYFRKAITLDPRQAQPHISLGVSLAHMQNSQEAEQCYRQAIALNPKATEAYNNLGLLLEEQRRPDEAAQCYRQAVALQPNNPTVLMNLALFLAQHGGDEEAERCFQRVLASGPDHAAARLNLGFLLLRQGRFSEGWPYYEARYHPSLIRRTDRPGPEGLPYPPWHGESLAGKSLLVWHEQGLGDTLQFCRYLSALKTRGATHITLVCQTSLKSLMESLAGVDTVITDSVSIQDIPRHDYWNRLLSLPLYLKTTLETLPAALPYLHADPARITHWSHRLPADGMRVGLVWKGSHALSNDSHRSLPGLTTLAPLWAIPGLHFISLQKGRDEDQARHSPAGQNLLHLGADLHDFGDTAAIVAQLDLVISVDTAVAHLAGALGKPCWVLLPAYRCDWRWLRGRDDSPWYPGVMRLFRQKSRGDWTAVINEVKNALQNFVITRPGS